MMHCTPQEHANNALERGKNRTLAISKREETRRTVLIVDGEGYSMINFDNYFENAFDICWRALEEDRWVPLYQRFYLYFWWWNYIQLPLNDGWHFVYENRNFNAGFPPKIIGYRHNNWSDDVYYDVDKHSKLINKYVIAWNSITKEIWRKIWIKQVCIV